MGVSFRTAVLEIGSLVLAMLKLGGVVQSQVWPRFSERRRLIFFVISFLKGFFIKMITSGRSEWADSHFCKHAYFSYLTSWKSVCRCELL